MTVYRKANDTEIKIFYLYVRVQLEFWENAHVRAMCVRPKIKCANVRACEAKNRRNSQIAFISMYKV